MEVEQQTVERIERELYRLPLRAQLLLMERLARHIAATAAPPDLAADLRAMAEDPEIQQELALIEEEFGPAEFDGLNHNHQQ
jgi:hypothetical protein